MPRVEIPSSLRTHTKGEALVDAAGATVGEVLRDVVARHPPLGARLFDERGQLARYVNVFVGEDDVRSLQALATPVRASDVLVLITAVAGG